MNQQTLGLVLGVSAMTFLGLGNVLSKVPIKYLSPTKLIFFSRLFTSAIFLVVLLLTLQDANFTIKYTSITALIALLGYFPLYFFYKAITSGKVGIVSPVSSSYTLLTTLLAILVYKEHLIGKQFFALGLIILGIVLISINFRDFKNSHLFQRATGLPYAILAALGWGFYFFLIRIPIEHLGAIPTSFIIEFVIFLTAGLSIVFSKQETLKLETKRIGPILLLAIFTCVGVLAYYQGIKIYSLSIMTTLAAASPLVVVIAGVLFFKEKINLKQIFSIVLIVSGLIYLSI